MTILFISLTGDPGAVIESALALVESDDNSLPSNLPKKITSDATLTLLPTKGRENRSGMAFDSFPPTDFILSIGSGVITTVISNYISEKLTKTPKGRIKLTINRRLVEFDEGIIRRVIEEETKTHG
jgi:hypothetical protein